MCTCERMCTCVCACVRLCECVYLCMCVRVCECVCVCACICECVCVFARVCVHVVGLCISAAAFLSTYLVVQPRNVNTVPTVILWGKTKVCEFCMAASCSCAPLPLAQPGLLLPAAGGRGLGGKGQAERGGHLLRSSLETANIHRYRPPKNLIRSP